ncbi:MAG: hypothetical protein IJ730_04100 [Alphaproteobacteria bacterium]|nr:hypothetical protein [Alphaproteobacteria bacterium]
MSLLPFNATKFEKDVESAIKYNVDVNGLAGFKFKDYGNLRLSLIWEYSLAQVNVDDLKTKITEGLKFHRLAGTPYSLRQALSWYNLNDITIEESKPGQHFAEFQIGFKEIPNSFEIDTIINVAKMAAPLRSRLVRMYNDEYDIRQFVLDSSKWGDILSDYSGVRREADGIKLSFGRSMACDAELEGYEVENFDCAERVCFALYENTFKLDCSKLSGSKVHKMAYDGTYFAERYSENTDRIGDKLPNKLIELQKFSKAMVVLSESVLEGEQTYFPGSYEAKNAKKFKLDFNCLSANVSKPETIAIEKRLYVSKTADGAFKLEPIVHGTTQEFHGIFEAFSNPIAERSDEVEMNVMCQYLGNNTWHDHRHFDVSWQDQNFYTVMNGG